MSSDPIVKPEDIKRVTYWNGTDRGLAAVALSILELAASIRYVAVVVSESILVGDDDEQPTSRNTGT